MQTVANAQKEHQKNNAISVAPQQNTHVEAGAESVVETGVPLFLQRFASSSSRPDQSQIQEDEDVTETSVLPKLTVGEPDDEYEQEADRIADKVMRMPESRDARILEEEDEQPKKKDIISTKPLGVLPVRRAGLGCDSRQESESCPMPEIQAKSSGTAPPFPYVSQDLLSSCGGSPLPENVRSRIEPVLGRDLSQVTVHSDLKANEAARSIHARAFTHQKRIFLGKGQSVNDIGLMSHEATHVVQQGFSGAYSKQGRNRTQQGGYAQAAVPAIQLSPLSDELAMIWTTEVKGVFFERLRHLSVSDADVYAFVETNLSGDDYWLARNLLDYGPESSWPTHLRVEREMKGWGDSGGSSAVFDILRAANGLEAVNTDLTTSLHAIFLAGSDDLWLGLNLQMYGLEMNWPIHLRVEREMKSWPDSGGSSAVFDILRAANGTEAYNLDLTLTIFRFFTVDTDEYWLADNLQAFGAETGWSVPLRLELKLRSGDKPGFYSEISGLAGSHAGDAAIRGALSQFVTDTRISWPEAFHAAALLELGPRRDWPQVAKNYDEGLSSGIFTIAVLPPAGAEPLRQFCMIQAGQAAEGSVVSARYRTRFNALWDDPSRSMLDTTFDPSLDSKGPRNERARSIFNTLYADASIKTAYDTNAPPGFREMCDTLMGPEGTNLIASPRLQRLRALLNPPLVTATGTADAPYVALVGTIRPAAEALDGPDRRQVLLSQSWRLVVDAKVAGGSVAVTRNLRDDLWLVVTTSRPAVAPVAATPSVPAPVEVPPTLNAAKRAWLSGITLTGATTPVPARTAEQDITFQVRNSVPNPGVPARRHIAVEPSAQVNNGQEDQSTWPTGRRSMPHTATVNADFSGAASQIFTARLNMPPVSSADFSEQTATITVEDRRRDWFVNNIGPGVTFMDENTRTALVGGSTVNYYGGQLALTVRPELPADNPGLQISMEGQVKKGGAGVHTFTRKPFGRTAISDQLGSYIEREGSAPPASEPMEIEVSFFQPTGPAIKTINLLFNVAPGLPVAAGTDAAILSADNNKLIEPATTPGSLLNYMTHNFPPSSPEHRVANAVSTNAIQVEAVIVRSDSAAWLTTHGGNPATQVAYACGNMSNARVLVNAPGAAGWRWPAFPNHVFLNLTPNIHAPTTRRPNSQMAGLLAHEGIHAADRIEAGPIGRYSTEFRAYWVMGVGSTLSTAPVPTMTGRGPKSERARAIFEHLYNSPLYSSFVRPNYDDNIDHFRERVDNMLVPDGINLALSGRLQALRVEIESYTITVPSSFTTKKTAIMARYTACNADDKIEITGNRAWRDLVENIFTLPTERDTIKDDLHIPR